jgi:hypothetical protein
MCPSWQGGVLDDVRAPKSESVVIEAQPEITQDCFIPSSFSIIPRHTQHLCETGSRHILLCVAYQLSETQFAFGSVRFGLIIIYKDNC